MLYRKYVESVIASVAMIILAAFIAVIYNTIISAGMTFLGVGFTAVFWPVWFAICQVLFLPGILVTLIVSPFIIRFAFKITEMQAPAGAPQRAAEPEAAPDGEAS